MRPPRALPDRGSLAVHTALRAAHAAYEAKFGHAFVHRADGRRRARPPRCSTRCWRACAQRLGHDEDEERWSTAEQLRRLCRATAAAATAPSSADRARAGCPRRVHPTVRDRSHLAYPVVRSRHRVATMAGAGGPYPAGPDRHRSRQPLIPAPGGFFRAGWNAVPRPGRHVVLGGSSSHRRPHLLLPVRARPRHRAGARLPRGLRQGRRDVQDARSSTCWSTAWSPRSSSTR